MRLRFSFRELGVVYGVATLGVILGSLLWRIPSQRGFREASTEIELRWHEFLSHQASVRIPLEIREAAVAEGVDPLLVTAIVQVESGFEPTARSQKGAIGLMQVLPETAALVGVSLVKEPGSNLRAGCRYLRVLFDEFGGDMELVLAAYNAGPGAVFKSGGIPPYRETQAFIQRVNETYRALSGQPIAEARVGFWTP